MTHKIVHDIKKHGVSYDQVEAWNLGNIYLHRIYTKQDLTFVPVRFTYLAHTPHPPPPPEII